MSFFAVLFALLIEQVRPLASDNPVRHAVTGWMRWAERNLDAGARHHAWVVWIAIVPLPAALAALIHVGLAHVNVLAAFAWSVIVLYLTLGFRQFSHHFTGIREALERGDDDEARRRLARWLHLDASELPRDELLRHVIEHALLAAHRHVFGAFFWYVALSAFGLGPAGAVLYRLSVLASRWLLHRSRAAGTPINPTLLTLVQRGFAVVDHVPARLTAFGFAVVGNFEQAIAGWRRDAELWTQPNEGIILAAAAGAVGVRLGGAPAPSLHDEPGAEARRPAAAAEGSTPGMAPRNAHLDSVVGLVWRSVVLWMLLLALLTVANILG